MRYVIYYTCIPSLYHQIFFHLCPCFIIFCLIILQSESYHSDIIVSVVSLIHSFWVGVLEPEPVQFLMMTFFLTKHYKHWECPVKVVLISQYTWCGCKWNGNVILDQRLLCYSKTNILKCITVPHFTQMLSSLSLFYITMKGCNIIC